MPTEQSLLVRIVETPELAMVVPRLPADILHRVIQSSGLEDSSALVAMSTPAQLAAVFDLDLWRSAQPGQDEQFDADRFGVWLEVLLESGADFAAATLAGIDPGVVTSALSQFVQVFDPASLAQPEPVADDDETALPRAAEYSAGIGGYKVGPQCRPSPFRSIHGTAGSGPPRRRHRRR